MRILVLFVICLFAACTSKPKLRPVYVSMTDSGRSVKFTGMDYAIISEIGRDTIQAAWKGLIPVFRMPADTDLMDFQPVQPGVYKLKDSSVVFTPDTPFNKGERYFMRYYRFDDSHSVWDYIKRKKKLNETSHTDLIFR